METVKKGSKGEPVSQLQTKLNKLGFKLTVDGQFGEATHNAVITVQSIFGYTVDGVVGQGTWNLMDQQIGLKWNLELARKAFAK